MRLEWTNKSEQKAKYHVTGPYYMNCPNPTESDIKFICFHYIHYKYYKIIKPKFVTNCNIVYAKIPTIAPKL
jgi:hypothetical protein